MRSAVLFIDAPKLGDQSENFLIASGLTGSASTEGERVTIVGLVECRHCCAPLARRPSPAGSGWRRELGTRLHGRASFPFGYFIRALPTWSGPRGVVGTSNTANNRGGSG